MASVGVPSDKLLHSTFQSKAAQVKMVRRAAHGVVTRLRWPCGIEGIGRAGDWWTWWRCAARRSGFQCRVRHPGQPFNQGHFSMELKRGSFFHGPKDTCNVNNLRLRALNQHKRIIHYYAVCLVSSSAPPGRTRRPRRTGAQVAGARRPGRT